MSSIQFIKLALALALSLIGQVTACKLVFQNCRFPPLVLLNICITADIYSKLGPDFWKNWSKYRRSVQPITQPSSLGGQIWDGSRQHRKSKCSFSRLILNNPVKTTPSFRFAECGHQQGHRRSGLHVPDGWGHLRWRQHWSEPVTRILGHVLGGRVQERR